MKDINKLNHENVEVNPVDPLNPINKISGEQKIFAGFIHFGAMLLALFTSWFVGFGGMAVAGIAYLVLKNDNNSFAREHAKEAFNFNFTMFLITLLACTVGVVLTVIIAVLTLGIGLFVIVPIAIFIILLMMLLWIVCSVLAGISGFQGKPYKYPFTWRILE